MILSEGRDSNPRSSPWQGDILPLNYPRINLTPFYQNQSLFFKRKIFFTWQTNLESGRIKIKMAKNFTPSEGLNKQTTFRVEKDLMFRNFLKVSKKTGVPIKRVLDMFYVLSSGEPVENNELLRKVGVARSSLNQIKEALSPLLRSSSKDTQLKEGLEQKVQTVFEADYTPEEQLFSILKDESYKKAIEILRASSNLRPSPKREYDQFTATLETTARRASLMDFFGDVRGKRTLFLGDDDFTSVAVASLKSAKEIAVVDIDERVLKGIAQMSTKHNFGIKTFRHDTREPLPRNLKSRFDVIFTDPPYTPNGIKLFVSRAIEALDNKNQDGRIYVCYGNSDRAKERFLPIYKILTDSGLMIRWVFDKFNRYLGTESIGSASTLFICDITPKTKPLVKGKFYEHIYTSN